MFLPTLSSIVIFTSANHYSEFINEEVFFTYFQDIHPHPLKTILKSGHEFHDISSLLLLSWLKQNHEPEHIGKENP